MNQAAKKPTIEDVDQRILSAQAALADNRTKLEQLEAKRRTLLLEGTEAEIVAVEKDISSVRLGIERLEERLKALPEERERLVKLEHERELEALRQRAERARHLGEQLITGEYADCARKMIAVLSKLAAIDVFIDNANSQLEDRCVERPERVRREPIVVIPARVEMRQREGWTDEKGHNLPPMDQRPFDVPVEIPAQRTGGMWLDPLHESAIIPPALWGGEGWDSRWQTQALQKARAEAADIVAKLLKADK
jgi:hypothetical protein